jgi:hypothetical protein
MAVGGWPTVVGITVALTRMLLIVNVVVVAVIGMPENVTELPETVPNIEPEPAPPLDVAIASVCPVAGALVTALVTVTAGEM